eukprot:CAMPEP_0175789892 /NCGR_PEP_ID=MMETSP0097-20121207/81636_1 /TAXON_ID=311494 /ORGANISM="Alexandrium monilatum, Strain CCMP3105" /LENGTH=198 /DNA_ID=CAMNT_0017100965 /DNA_START=106 /DNA_END=704 /DNA_ORIENTATION=+
MGQVCSDIPYLRMSLQKRLWTTSKICPSQGSSGMPVMLWSCGGAEGGPRVVELPLGHEAPALGDEIEEACGERPLPRQAHKNGTTRLGAGPRASPLKSACAPTCNRPCAESGCSVFVGLTGEWTLSTCLFNFITEGRRFVTKGQLHNARPTFGTSHTTYNITGMPEDPWDGQIFEVVQRRFWSDIRKYGISLQTCPME